MSYLIILVIQMVNKDGSIINSVTMVNSLFSDSRKYNVNDNSFAFGLISIYKDYSKLSDPSYFSIEMTQNKIASATANSTSVESTVVQTVS